MLTILFLQRLPGTAGTVLNPLLAVNGEDEMFELCTNADGTADIFYKPDDATPAKQCEPVNVEIIF